MGIIAGDLRYSITVNSLSSVKGDYGAVTDTYTLLMTIRAGVKFVSGTKRVDEKEIFSSQVVQFTTHYRHTITETCRIVFDSRKYRILSIDVIGFKEGLLINAELINE